MSKGDQVTECKACGKPVIFATDWNGDRVCLDAQPMETVTLMQLPDCLKIEDKLTTHTRHLDTCDF